MDSINLDINAEFGVTFDLEDFLEVGDENPQQEAAFPSAIAMPQFLPKDSEGIVPGTGLPTHTGGPQFLGQDGNLHPTTKTGPNPWPPQLIMDLALNIDLEETVLERHGLTPIDLEKLYTIPQFRREIAFLMRELRDTGVTFSRKAATQAEEYLSIMDDVMRSADTPASTRLAIFSKVTTLGKLDPVIEKEDTTNANQVNVVINL